MNDSAFDFVENGRSYRLLPNDTIELCVFYSIDPVLPVTPIRKPAPEPAVYILIPLLTLMSIALALAVLNLRLRSRRS